MVKRISDKVVEASGGIVERAMPGGVRIALIHRVRYGSGVGLAERQAPAQRILATYALREVKEETGLDAKITGIAGATAYFAKGVPKPSCIGACGSRVICRHSCRMVELPKL